MPSNGTVKASRSNPYRLTCEQLADMERRAAAGQNNCDIARALGVSSYTVARHRKARGWQATVGNAPKNKINVAVASNDQYPGPHRAGVANKDYQDGTARVVWNGNGCGTRVAWAFLDKIE